MIAKDPRKHWSKTSVALSSAAVVVAVFLYYVTFPSPPIDTFPRVQAWAEAGDFFNYRGHAIFFRSSGFETAVGEASPSAQELAKPVLLLLHGFPTSSFDWLDTWDSLATNYRLIAPDFLGFGLSDKPDHYDYTMVEQATLTEELMAALGVTDFHILAHDYGDSVAQELLARSNAGVEPGHLSLKSIMFLNGGLMPGLHRPLLVQEALASPWSGPILRFAVVKPIAMHSLNRVFGANTKLSQEQQDEMWALICNKGGNLLSDKLLQYMHERMEQKPRWEAALKEAKVPLRLVNGPADPVSGNHVLLHYIEHLDEPDTVRLDDAIGHYPQIEDPSSVLSALAAFHANHFAF